MSYVSISLVNEWEQTKHLRSLRQSYYVVYENLKPYASFEHFDDAIECENALRRGGIDGCLCAWVIKKTRGEEIKCLT